MIARTWHGRVPNDKAEAYHAYLLRTGLADYAATAGNEGVWVFRRTEGDITHFVLTTLWRSVEAIKRFAGEDYEQARYYPEDDAFLLEREPFVTHYDVLRLQAPEGMRRPNMAESKPDLLDTFSTTGHQTLNAFLLVSGGVAASFLAFLGATFQDPAILQRIGNGAADLFVEAMKFFMASIVVCLIAHGSTFLSHAAYYTRKESAGKILMVVTSLLMGGVVWALILGCSRAFEGFSLGLERLRQSVP